MTPTPSDLRQMAERLELRAKHGKFGQQLDREVAAMLLAIAEAKPMALFEKYGSPTIRDRDMWNAGYASGKRDALPPAAEKSYGWDRERLRILVDLVWQHALEDQQVPATYLADQLIDSALKSRPAEEK